MTRNILSVVILVIVLLCMTIHCQADNDNDHGSGSGSGSGSTSETKGEEKEKDQWVKCRDPDLGGQLPSNHKNSNSNEPTQTQRKYLLISGGGAGIGNFLVFFPSAYYFAMFTNRDIIIMDDSLIGEMCKIMRCGFPLLSEISKLKQ